jgi:hypothetical protein
VPSGRRSSTAGAGSGRRNRPREIVRRARRRTPAGCYRSARTPPDGAGAAPPSG